MAGAAASKATVCVIDDDENDRLFFSRAFQKLGLPHRLILLEDGEDAQHYLTGKAPYTRDSHPAPDLIFLDLKMSKLPGFDLLDWMRECRTFARVPVVILSSSDLERDKVQARGLGTVAFYTKPGNPKELEPIITQCCSRWLPAAAKV
jgi:CheY-like chemotaxis protein